MGAVVVAVVTLCRETGALAVAGACPEHRGDACLLDPAGVALENLRLRTLLATWRRLARRALTHLAEGEGFDALTLTDPEQRDKRRCEADAEPCKAVGALIRLLEADVGEPINVTIYAGTYDDGIFRGCYPTIGAATDDGCDDAEPYCVTLGDAVAVEYGAAKV